MTIAHKNIPEDGLHEPKGVSTAAANRVYKSNGAGSGVWSQVDSNTLSGLVTNNTPAGRRVVTDGSGGFNAEVTPASSFGSMNLTDNVSAKAVTAATDSSLNTDSDFQELDIAFSFENLEGMTSGANYLQVSTGGLYLVDFWAGVKSDINATKFSLKFVVNGTDFVTRGAKLTLGTGGQVYNLSANGLHSFSVSDQVKLFIAADKSCNITIEDMTFQMVLLRGL